MNIDHVCLAVRSIDKSIDKLCSMIGYSIKTGKVTNSSEEVNVQFIHKKGSIDIKLIEPLHKNSPLMNFLKKGEGLHHLCFKSSDLNEEIVRLESAGAKLLSSPCPGEAFDDENIAFLWLGSGLNIELIDTDRRRNLKNQ